jgi:uncharacterized protein YidB (DUF937 family)
MSLFDDLSSQLSGALGGAAGQHPALLGHVADLMNNPATGGFNGLVQAFHDHGLGGVVSSWIGTGANQSISADQISKVLGPERVQLIAGKLGVAPETVSTQLATMLPALINHLTPNGTVPSSGVLQQALETLKPKPAPA